MNAFEQIVAGLFRTEGYWTITGYRVNLTKQEKKEAGKPSLPRPKLDILAYKGITNELVWIECKSYLDSTGVRYSSFINENDPGFQRYKVYNDTLYRKVISKALIEQTVLVGLTRSHPILSYCLVAGKVYSEKDRENLREHFSNNGWLFYDNLWLKEKLKNAADSQYEDDTAMIVAKIIQRI